MSDLISRQAAIDAIEGLPNCYNGYSDTYDKACIIGALEELPPAQPEKRTEKHTETHARDLIDRQATLRHLYGRLIESANNKHRL